MLQQKGEYLHGESQADIEQFLCLSWPYELASVRPMAVGEERELIVWFDTNAGAAAVQRKQDELADVVFIEDSALRWEPRAAVRMICSCGSDVHEVSIGRQAAAGGKSPWVIVGTRCPRCGMLASPLDWNQPGPLTP